MKTKVEEAIEVLAEKAHKAVHANEALHYSQAALNLANIGKAMTEAEYLSKSTDQI